MEKITVYEKPTCTTCKKVATKLQEKGIEFDKVNYYIKPFSKELDFKNKSYTEAEVLELMIKNPDLVQRPIIEIGDKAVLARPAEKIDELF